MWVFLEHQTERHHRGLDEHTAAERQWSTFFPHSETEPNVELPKEPQIVNPKQGQWDPLASSWCWSGQTLKDNFRKLSLCTG